MKESSNLKAGSGRHNSDIKVSKKNSEASSSWRKGSIASTDKQHAFKRERFNSEGNNNASRVNGSYRGYQNGHNGYSGHNGYNGHNANNQENTEEIEIDISNIKYPMTSKQY
jgi:hypothetical protein